MILHLAVLIQYRSVTDTHTHTDRQTDGHTTTAYTALSIASRGSEPSRVTRPTNPRLLANPSHRRKRLLIYRRCHYFLIFPLLTYCCPHYIFFAQDGHRIGGMPEAEVVQNRQFIPTSLCLFTTKT